MRILAEKGSFNLIEEEHDWVLVYKESGEECKRFSKKEEPVYPIALVVKWGYRIVDHARMDEIAEQNKEG